MDRNGKYLNIAYFFILSVVISLVFNVFQQAFENRYHNQVLFEAQSKKEIYKEAGRFEIDVNIQVDERLLKMGKESDVYVEQILNIYRKSVQKDGSEYRNRNIDHRAMDEKEILGIFKIEADEIIQMSGDFSKEEIEKIKFSFKLFTKLIPSEIRGSLAKIQIYKNSASAAYISFEKNSISKHILGLNLEELIDEHSDVSQRYEMILLFVHELAHLIAMQEDQIKKSGICFNPVGETFDCHIRDSYMNEFNLLFWSDVDIYFRNNSLKKEEDLNRFYELNQEHFLNIYAATNPYEDFAESFMTFVSCIKDDSQETGLDKKILFFYRYEEMILIRKALLQNMVTLLSQDF